MTKAIRIAFPIIILKIILLSYDTNCFRLFDTNSTDVVFYFSDSNNKENETKSKEINQDLRTRNKLNGIVLKTIDFEYIVDNKIFTCKLPSKIKSQVLIIIE